MIKEWYLDSPLERGGILFGMDTANGKQKVFLDDDIANSVVIGKAGSGKTRRVLIPSIWEIAKSGESLIIADRRGEIYNSTCSYLSKQGYNFIFINLIENSDFNLDIINYEDISVGKTAIFIIFDYEADRNIARLVIERTYNYLENNIVDKENRKIVNYILDDFSLILCINNFDQMLKNAPIMESRFILSIQSIDQIKYVYNDKFETILRYLGNIIYLGTSDINTAKFISKIAGNTIINTISRPLFVIEELMRIDNETVLYLSNGNLPKSFTLPDMSKWIIKNELDCL